MGSFNTTCFATRQTIAPDDAVFIFPVVQVNGYAPTPVVHIAQGDKRKFEAYGPSTFTYPNALWHPLGFALRATYEDYGNFKLEKSAFNRQQLHGFYRRLKDWACHTPKGSNPYHEKAFTLTNLLKVSKLSESEWETLFVSTDPLDQEKADTYLEVFWTELQEAVSSSRVFIRRPQGNSQPAMLRFAVASQVAVGKAPDAYAHLASIYEGGSSYTPTSEVFTNLVLALKQYWSDCLKNKSKPTLQGVSHALIAHCTYCKGFPSNSQLDAMLQIAIENQEVVSDLALQFVLNQVFTMLGHTERALFRVGEHSGMDGLDSVFVVAVAKELRSITTPVAKEELSEELTSTALNPLMAISDFLSLLNAMSVSFTPMMYASQDYSNDLGKAYARWVHNTCGNMPRSKEEN